MSINSIGFLKSFFFSLSFFVTKPLVKSRCTYGHVSFSLFSMSFLFLCVNKSWPITPHVLSDASVFIKQMRFDAGPNRPESVIEHVLCTKNWTRSSPVISFAAAAALCLLACIITVTSIVRHQTNPIRKQRAPLFPLGALVNISRRRPPPTLVVIIIIADMGLD